MIISTPNPNISVMPTSRKNRMLWKGAPGLYLKMPTAPGNTSKISQRTPLNDLRETLTGILVEIDSDTCHIL
jgi:hypothetical protein